MLCGGCAAGYARDNDRKPCTSCTGLRSNSFLIIEIIIDCLGKAAFALYATKRYMYTVAHVGKLDSVLMRVFIQFTTVSAVLKDIDFSSLELYSWQTKDQQQSAGQSTFRFPIWFNGYLNQLLGFSGSVPTMSMQQALECLAIRWGPGDHDENMLYRRRVLPYIFWLCYPIIIVFWTAVLAVLLAKLGGPFSQRLRKRQQQRLVAMLIEAGVSQQTADAAAAKDTDFGFSAALVGKTELPSLEELAERYGVMVVSEIVADAMLSNAELLPDILHEKREGDAHARKRHAAAWLRGMFTLEGFRRFPPERDMWSAHVLRSYQQQTSKQIEMQRSMQPNLQPEEQPQYPIFDLFRNTKVITVLQDACPAFLITLYSIWEVATRRYLLALNAMRIPIKIGEDEQGVDIMQRRDFWVQDMGLKAMTGGHEVVSMLGFAGLIIWSIGVPFGTFLVCRLRCRRLQEGGTKRLLGFFYVGLEPTYYWWELCVKRADVFVIFVVAYSHFFQTQKAKLITYMGLAAIAWTFHAATQPFDNARGRLVDRTENLALKTRFVSFFLINMMLLLDGGLVVNSIAAVVVLGMNAFLILRTTITILTEIVGADRTRMVRKRPARATCAARMAGVVRGIKDLVLGSLRALENERLKHQREVPVIVWYGVQQHASIWIGDQSRKQSNLLLYHIARRLYNTDDDSQKEYAIQTICEMFLHAMMFGSMSCWPSDIFDRLILLPIAMRRVQERHNLGTAKPDPTWIKCEICHIMKNSASDAELANSNALDAEDVLKPRYFQRHEDFEYYATADDLADALVYLQGLQKNCLVGLFKTGLMANDEVLSSKAVLSGTDEKTTTRDEVCLGPSHAGHSLSPQMDTTKEAADTSSAIWSFQKPLTLIELEKNDPTLAKELKDFIEQTAGDIIEAVAKGNLSETASDRFMDIRQRVDDHEVMRAARNLHDTSPHAGKHNMNDCGTQTQEHQTFTEMTSQLSSLKQTLTSLSMSAEKTCTYDAAGTEGIRMLDDTIVQLDCFLENAEHQIQQLFAQVDCFSSIGDEFEALSVKKSELSHLRMKIPMLATEFKAHLAELETQIRKLCGAEAQLKALLDSLRKCKDTAMNIPSGSTSGHVPDEQPRVSLKI